MRKSQRQKKFRTPKPKPKKRPPIVKIFSFALISAFLIIFYTLLLSESTFFVKIVLFTAALFLAEGLHFTMKRLTSKKQNFRQDVETIISIILASAVTFSLNIGGMGPVVAAAFVGLFYAVIAEKIGKRMAKLSAPVYCGTFVGMCAKFLFADLWMVGFAGALAGIGHVISDGSFDGVGGKLGTIAFIGTFSAPILIGIIDSLLVV